MNCPRCAVPMAPFVYEANVEVDRCGRCGGTWLDQDELERIQQLHDPNHRVAAARSEDMVDGAIEMARQRDLPPIACPTCGDAAERKEYGMASQVMIDACPHGHGLWLDAGELETLEAWFERMRTEGNDDAEGFGLFASLFRVWRP